MGCKDCQILLDKIQAMKGCRRDDDKEYQILIGQLAEQGKYIEFFNYVTNLFAEGVEFMTKEQILDSVKKEWRRTLEA